MKNVREIYITICNTSKLPPDENVLKALMVCKSTSVLDLSGIHVPKDTCSALAQLLAMSCNINHVNLSDCLLPPRGLSAILKTISHISGLKTLNLRGNNISGNTISQLGQTLEKNASLRQLFLEWNCLGLFPDMFKKFCSGLARNATLEELDLKNNQLTPECSAILGVALAENKCLRIIDLSWNSLGWQGAQHMFLALQHNKHISSIYLQGNSIPGDITLAIEQCTLNNQSRNLLINECSSRNKVLEEQVRKLKTKHTLQIEGLVKRNEDVIRETEVRLNSAHELISEHNSELAKTHVKLKSAESQIRQLENSNCKLQCEIQNLQEQQKVEMDKSHLEMDKLHKKHQLENKSLLEEISILKERLITTQGKLSDLESKQAIVDDEIRRLEAVHKGETELVKQKCEDEIMRIKKIYEQKFQKIQVETEERLSEQQSDAQRAHHHLTDRIHLQESTINGLEKKILDQSAHIAKLSKVIASAAELSALAVQEAKEKEVARANNFEGQFRAMEEEKLKVDQQLRKSQHTISQLQEKNDLLVQELLEPQRKIFKLQEELGIEHENIVRLRAEKAEEVARAEALTAEVNKLQIELQSLHKCIDQMKDMHALSEKERHAERRELLDEIQQRDKNIKNMRSEEAERITTLYSALTKYMKNLQSGLSNFKDCDGGD